MGQIVIPRRDLWQPPGALANAPHPALLMGTWRDSVNLKQHYTDPFLPLTGLPTSNLIGKFEADGTVYKTGTTTQAVNLDQVGTWVDASSAAVNQASGGPTTTIFHSSGGPNSMPYIAISVGYFYGASNITPNMTGNCSFTVSIVCSPNPSANMAFWGFGSVGGGAGHSCAMIENVRGTRILSAEGSSFEYGQAATAITNNSWQSYTLTKAAGACNTTTTIYEARTAQTMSAGTTSTPSIDANPFAIGRWAEFSTGNTYYFTGGIAAVYIYNAVLTSTQLTNLWNYQQKYLPSL